MALACGCCYCAGWAIVPPGWLTGSVFWLWVCCHAAAACREAEHEGEGDSVTKLHEDLSGQFCQPASKPASQPASHCCGHC